jgi:hypothetical protein
MLFAPSTPSKNRSLGGVREVQMRDSISYEIGHDVQPWINHELFYTPTTFTSEPEGRQPFTKGLLLLTE